VISLGEAFQELLAQLDRFEIRYLIGGSVASSSYGMPRQTNDIDILADFKGVDIHALCQLLSGEFYLDPEAVLSAVQTGRPFNVIHAKGIFKFDFFPAADQEFALSELNRRRFVVSMVPGLQNIEFPIASAEDTLLAKLVWFRKGGESSEQQWRDIQGIARVQSVHLDLTYLDKWAIKLGVLELLERAMVDAK